LIARSYQLALLFCPCTFCPVYLPSGNPILCSVAAVYISSQQVSSVKDIHK